MKHDGIVIDLCGPEGNVFHVAGLAQSWNNQLGKKKRGSLFDATATRLGHNHGGYEDVLDTFDEWFKGKITYTFLNDPRDPDIDRRIRLDRS